MHLVMHVVVDLRFRADANSLGRWMDRLWSTHNMDQCFAVIVSSYIGTTTHAQREM